MPFSAHVTFKLRRLRHSFIGLIILVITTSLALLFHLNSSCSDDILMFLDGLPMPEGGSNPPRFYEWHEREKKLPQNNPDLPYPQGKEGRYIRFANQVRGACIFPLVRAVFFRQATSIYETQLGKVLVLAMPWRRWSSMPTSHTLPNERMSPLFSPLLFFSVPSSLIRDISSYVFENYTWEATSPSLMVSRFPRESP
jgi:hypothetical protein